MSTPTPKKKIAAIVKLTIGAGKANPAPPVGTALGPKGVNIAAFCTDFNNRTKHLELGAPSPVEITIYADKSFTFVLKNPPTSYLVRKAAEPAIDKASSNPGKDIVAKIKRSKITEIAKIKKEDMGVHSLEAAERTVCGTATSMGIQVIEG